MPEPLDSIQPVNIERVPESKPTRQMRDDQEDFYPHLERQKQRKDSEDDHQQSQPKQSQDTYERETRDDEKPPPKKAPPNQAKIKKTDTIEGPGFVLDIKV